MPKIDVLASDFDQVGKIAIQVKAKHGGTAWQTNIRKGRPWILVEVSPTRSSTGLLHRHTRADPKIRLEEAQCTLCGSGEFSCLSAR
jgi:hypothetical protein